MKDAKHPDIKGLKEFANRMRTHDRDEAPFFSGRKAEIAAVADACAAAVKTIRRREDTQKKGSMRPSPVQSCTILFQGAPGAGKSSLLAELENRFAAEPPDRRPTVLAGLPRSTLANRDLFIAELAVAIGGWPKGGFLSRITATVSGELALPGAGGAGVNLGLAPAAAPPPLSLTNLAVRLRRRKTPQRAILVMLDEIQNVTHDRHGDLLTELHEGQHGLPIVPVYGGLGNSRQILKDCGVTRWSAGHVRNIGTLEPNEALKTVGKFFNRFRVAGDDAVKAAWAAKLAAASDCWPEHLHTALQALAHALVGTAGCLFSQVGPRAEAVVADARARRHATYGDRWTDELRSSAGLLARFMARLAADDGGLPLADVIDAIEALDHGRTGATAERLPRGWDAEGYVDLLVRRGVLQHDADIRQNRMHCPIPSLSDWLIRQGGLEPAAARPQPVAGVAGATGISDGA